MLKPTLSLMLVQLFLFCQGGPRADSYRYAVTPTGDDKKKGKGKKDGDLDELKQELDMDEHKIPIEELYERLGVDPTNVSC